jgi:hypothetical protein
VDQDVAKGKAMICGYYAMRAALSGSTCASRFTASPMISKLRATSCLPPALLDCC